MDFVWSASSCLLIYRFPERGLLCDLLVIFAQIAPRACAGSPLHGAHDHQGHRVVMVPGGNTDARAPFKWKLSMPGDRLE